MRHFTIYIGGLLLFGMGFFAGHYQASGNFLDITTTVSDTVSQTEPKNPKGDSPTNIVGSTPSFRLPTTTTNGSNPQPSMKAILPPGLVLTAEEQAQLAAQQLEARQADIKQMEAMIQSMEEGGAPAEDIKNFREMKKAMEEQPIEEPQVSEPNLPERTEAELKEEFAASLEEAGIPPAEREQMMDAFSTQFDPPAENTDIEPDLPPQPK